ncbi:HAMP domain-containing sensor histidine kinase [Dyadobacter sp. 676]|uniref:histidine kinase n=1 Tax=Dyadobacter sp. 676 TaxID=3088362 RepID=A0AAU8FUB3_9BACT
MTFSHNPDGTAVSNLAHYLVVRRPQLLDDWHNACQADLSLNAGTSLSSKQFRNQIPLMLDMLGLRLESRDDGAQFNVLASNHGLHRWQKGYSLSELVAEMQHLCRLLLAQFRSFWQLQPSSDCDGMSHSYEQLFEFGNQVNTGSIAQYADLQKQAAFRRVDALQKALDEINEMAKQRSNLLRHSSHDLRGSFGALLGAASLLELTDVPESDRKMAVKILHSNLSNCRSLITQLMDLARLEAGQDVVDIQAVDVGQLLTGLVMAYQPLANERGILLKGEGPASLPVECDPVQLQRIIQNLVLNALKHTTSGWVAVCWEKLDNHHWMVSIQDTGPGLPTSMQSHPLDQVQVMETVFTQKGEGIGLSIVKGLCELLRANLQIESKPGEGTKFNIRLAIGWQS